MEDDIIKELTRPGYDGLKALFPNKSEEEIERMIIRAIEGIAKKRQTVDENEPYRVLP